MQWPPALKNLLSELNFINLNVELVAPECSVAWDFGKQLSLILISPIVCTALIVVNSLVHFAVHKHARTVYVRRCVEDAITAADEKSLVDKIEREEAEAAVQVARTAVEDAGAEFDLQFAKCHVSPVQ